MPSNSQNRSQPEQLAVAGTGETAETPGRQPAWVQRALEKLRQLSQFGFDWDSHGGLPLQPEVRDFAFRLLGWLSDEELPVPAVVLGSGGTVQFEWQVKGREIQIEILAPGRLDWLKAYPDGKMEEGHFDPVTVDQVRRLTRWVAHG